MNYFLGDSGRQPQHSVEAAKRRSFMRKQDQHELCCLRQRYRRKPPKYSKQIDKTLQVQEVTHFAKNAHLALIRQFAHEALSILIG